MIEEKPSVNMHVEHITEYLSKEEQEKLPLKDLLFVKEGDLIIGHDRLRSELIDMIGGDDGMFMDKATRKPQKE